MGDVLLIYGASGFTGRLIVNEALARGLRPLLGGRNRETLTTLARPNALEVRAASLDDALGLRRMLEGVTVLLNAAGPFRMTALPLARACLESGVHYLDIGGEFATTEALARLHQTAIDNSCMILPSVGFDVVASDCMASWVSARLPGARNLWIRLTGLNSISRGSAETVIDQDGCGITVRREGKLVSVAPGELTRHFDFGQGLRRAAAVGWVDVASAYYTTGIPNITVYYEETAIIRLGLGMNRYGSFLTQTPAFKWMQGTAARLLPPGPSVSQRAAGCATVGVHAQYAQGKCLQVRVHTTEVYSFTAATSVAIADLVLGGNYSPGFPDARPCLRLGIRLVTSGSNQRRR